MKSIRLKLAIIMLDLLVDCFNYKLKEDHINAKKIYYFKILPLKWVLIILGAKSNFQKSF